MKAKAFGSAWLYEQDERRARLERIGTKWSLGIMYFPRIYSDYHTWDVTVYWEERYTPDSDSALIMAGSILDQEWPHG